MNQAAEKIESRATLCTPYPRVRFSAAVWRTLRRSGGSAGAPAIPSLAVFSNSFLGYCRWKRQRRASEWINRADFRGFEILSRGSAQKDSEPELLIRGKAIYKANLNPENPLGTIASIEHTLRGLDRRAEDEQCEIERQEKAFADYHAQLGRAFEHEGRLRDLLARQAQLNACLDLDKHEAQVVDEPREAEEEAVSITARRPASSAPAVVLAAQPPAVG